MKRAVAVIAVGAAFLSFLLSVPAASGRAALQCREFNLQNAMGLVYGIEAAVSRIPGGDMLLRLIFWSTQSPAAVPLCADSEPGASGWNRVDSVRITKRFKRKSKVKRLVVKEGATPDSARGKLTYQLDEDAKPVSVKVKLTTDSIQVEKRDD